MTVSRRGRAQQQKLQVRQTEDFFKKLDQCNSKGSALPAGQEWDQLYGTMREIRENKPV